ncbi:hypothetical protein CEXT_455361 [Caerostris extrusa]|uniref:Uncharacterized protein n=1 Tax=Caerostris extrusa TaxID=172846 RepID=A0AAV4W5I7_CAEEX|nr:hypothetical protein CEXT_455361 [Caerostris extrusa]
MLLLMTLEAERRRKEVFFQYNTSNNLNFHGKTRRQKRRFKTTFGNFVDVPLKMMAWCSFVCGLFCGMKTKRRFKTTFGNFVDVPLKMMAWCSLLTVFSAECEMQKSCNFIQ